MALLEDMVADWGTPTLVGFGVVLAAPLLLPAVGAVIRPVAKGMIKGSLFIVDSVRTLVSEGGEQLGDLVAEARAEYATGTAATTRR